VTVRVRGVAVVLALTPLLALGPAATTNDSFLGENIDSSGLNAAGRTISTGLADGAHTFRVVATDSVGLVDATPASRTWTVDATAPNASVRVLTQRLARAIAKGVRLDLATNEAATLTVTLFYRGRAIGIARTSRARAGQRLVVLKVYARGRKALRKVGKAALTPRLTAKDAPGNPRKVSKRFTLRR
jgi:hypothetical protein